MYQSGGCTWSRGVYLVWGEVPGPRGVPGPGGMYLVWGVPGLGGTWSRGVYLVQGGTWFWGGVHGSGVVVPGLGWCTWSGECTWSQGVYLVPGSVPGQVLAPPPLWTESQMPVKT